MIPLEHLSVRPPGVVDAEHFVTWFGRIAGRLLNGCDFLVAGDPYRFVELEAYYHSIDHPDPFPHNDPVQRFAGRWYFHRIGRGYRGGTFKGLDLTLGDGTTSFGLLIRGVIDPDGQLIAGPSRTVDALLARTGASSVAVLDEWIAGRLAWNLSSPLAIRTTEVPRADTVYRTARIGLTLKNPRDHERRVAYIDRPYRFTTLERLASRRSRASS